MRRAGAHRSRCGSSTGPRRSSTRPSASCRTSSRGGCAPAPPRRAGPPRRRARSPGARAARRPSRGGSRASAEQLVYAGFLRDLLQIGAAYGLGLTVPRLDDPDFVSALVFDPARGATTPKARFASLFPSSESAVIQVRLEPDLSDARAPAGGGARAGGGGDAGVAAAQRDRLHGHGRARGRGGPRGRADRRDVAAAAARGRGHGARPRRRVPPARAARAARRWRSPRWR